MNISSLPRFLPATLLVALLPCASAQMPSAKAETPTAFWWADTDGDRLPDAISVRPSGEVLLMRNDGDGGFDDITASSGLADIHGVRQILPQDVDGDGLPELFLTVPDGTSRFLANRSPNGFSPLATVGLDLEGVQFARFLDFDLDGNPDLHLTTHAGELLHHNLGEGAFERIELGRALALGPPAQSEELFPLDVGAVERLAAGMVLTGALVPPTPAPTKGSVDELQLAPRCLGAIRDQATGACLQASSAPMIGMLHPLGLDFNIDPSGNVGIGTLTPQSTLHVEGSVRLDQMIASATSGPPIVVISTDVATNLNADMLDGFHATDFSQLGTQIETAEIANDAVTATKIASSAVGSSEIATSAVGSSEIATAAVGTSEIANGSIVDADVSAVASILGTKINADFGSQTVTMTGKVGIGTTNPAEELHVTGQALFTGGTSTTPALIGRSINGPTNGHVGVQGTNDFDGVLSADWSGLELGVVGVSTGSSNTDNFGVIGHSNGSGVRGEHADDPTVDYGELGNPNVGVFGSGALYGVEASSPQIGLVATGTVEGVIGSCSAPTGYAVWGIAGGGAGDSSRGVFGQTSAHSGVGVYGWANAGSGSGSGVVGRCETGSGNGVEGRNYGTDGTQRNVGVYATSDSGMGVRGVSFGTGPNSMGVYGVSYLAGYGVFSEGDFGATGTKSFLHPHPTDPSKEIRFVALEGNEAGTYFRGSTRIVNGSATIAVPEEFRYVTESEGLTVHLTTVGGPAVVWTETKGLDRIVIRGSNDVEVDYQVQGIRQGYRDFDRIIDNRHFVPDERGVPFGGNYPEGMRRTLVENGILNADFTPNEATAERLGWRLRDAETDDAVRARHEEARADIDRERTRLVRQKVQARAASRRDSD